jgi:hypothetical protein
VHKHSYHGCNNGNPIRTTAGCSKHSYHQDAIKKEATTRADAITAEALARTTADGLKTQLS